MQLTLPLLQAACSAVRDIFPPVIFTGHALVSQVLGSFPAPPPSASAACKVSRKRNSGLIASSRGQGPVIRQVGLSYPVDVLHIDRDGPIPCLVVSVRIGDGLRVD